MTADTITYRGYHGGDETRIVELFQVVFERNCGVGAWKWAYRDNPQRRVDAVLAFCGEASVGYARMTTLCRPFSAWSGFLDETSRYYGRMVGVERAEGFVFRKLCIE